MNKFLKKKPAEVAVNDDALHALSSTPSLPSPTLNNSNNSNNIKKSSNSRWKKNKKQPAPTPPQLDLTAALPSTDDFRTSLIMPSLSTRFSMLREQDDPKSLLGKASDDSVLQPRRKSRMMDFNFGATGLSDIAEVSSINGSVRPPFAHESRQHSFVSEEGYGSDPDATPLSVMGRSRPGEGNILFGGRQKVYKIPAGGAGSTRSLGKLVYEDDVGMSAFQKYRQKEREHDESQLPRTSDESQAFDFGLEQGDSAYHDDSGLDALPNDSAKDLSHSPSLSSYDKKRSTTSSTTRSEARSSTAATSVASQPLASAQPSPAQAPVNMASSGNAATPSPTPGMSLDRSNTKSRRLYEQGLDQHMQDQQTSAISRLNSIQRQRALSGKKSPPFLHGAKSVGNLQDRSAQPVYALGPASPPPSAPLPQLKTLGSIRKPRSSANSPTLSNPQSPVDFAENDIWTRALEPGDRGKATAMGAFNKPAQAFDEQQYLERQKALQRSNSSAVMKNRATPQATAGASPIVPQEEPLPLDAAARSRAESTSNKREATKAYNVFQNAAQQLPKAPQEPSTAPARSPLPDTHRTFFGNISASEDEDDDEESSIAQSFSEYGYGIYQPQRWQPTPLPSVSEHPALRGENSKASLTEADEELEPGPLNHAASSQSLRIDAAKSKFGVSPPLDSPTLGPQAQALNGMVHHLRQRSNQSSLYPTDDQVPQDDDVPDVPEVPWNGQKSDSLNHLLGASMDHQSTRDSYAISNPWDLDEQSFADHSRTSRASLAPYDEAPGMETASDRTSDFSFARDGVPKARDALAREESEYSLAQGPEPAWQRDLRKQHMREASTATQQEREAFANELAARRNAIQENIKSIVERDASNSRGTSPAPSASNPMRAFGMLRSKTSRESMAHAHENSSKAMKTLGYSVENSPRIPMPTAQHPAFKTEGPGPSRDMDLQQADRVLASSRSIQSRNGRARSRSNSATNTGRSRSHTGPYRDDLEKAMVEGRGTSTAVHSPDMSPFPGASPDIMNLAGRSSDEGRAYFDTKNGSRLAQNGPSPVTLTSHVYAPGRPVPVANPYSQNTTPPLNGSTPGIGSEAYSPIVPTSARPGGNFRRKTVSKHDISEPTLISSTSNVDTVDLPPGASLKNGMSDPPPIPPINPRRRTTRKIFGRGRSDSKPQVEPEPRATASDPALNSSPKRNEYHFPPSNVVRMPSRHADESPAAHQYDVCPINPPDLSVPPVPQRSVTAPLDGGMF